MIWFLYGRDPESRPIVVQYEPPYGVSAAVARFMYIKNADYISLGSLIVQIVSKGFWSIHVTDDGYELQRQQKSDADCGLTAEETLVAETMMDGEQVVHVNRDYSETVETALSDLKKTLERDRALYFADNRLRFRYGVVLAILVSLFMWPSYVFTYIAPEKAAASAIIVLVVWFLVRRNSHLRNFSFRKVKWRKRLIAVVNSIESTAHFFETVKETLFDIIRMIVPLTIFLVIAYAVVFGLLASVFVFEQTVFIVVNGVICLAFAGLLQTRTEKGVRLFEAI